MLNARDTEVIRQLASQVADIASLPVQEEKRHLWRQLNKLQPQRPMVMIDQVCWNEMNINDELTLLCTDDQCRAYETQLRRTLYQWRHFPVDRVIEPFIRVPMAIEGTDFGIRIREETAVSDPSNAVVAHQYENQFQTDDDLQKLQLPSVRHDTDKTQQRLAVAHHLFDGILAVHPQGYAPYLSLWDPISMWMGVQNALYTLIDRPHYMHQLADRLTTCYLTLLDQLEAQGLLCNQQSLIHCTGAYTDELPAANFNPDKPRTKDLWMFGLAQMFATVSPKMFKEFEVDYTSRICERFGLVYYGCCDPLDGKMAEVRQLPNVRKVSMSPWVNQQRGAEAIHGDYVFSSKPNPAHVAMETLDPDLIRQELTDIATHCANNNCPLEFILKDISTVCYQPQRLTTWANIATEIAHQASG